MREQPKEWETYEQVAVYILNQIAPHLGLEYVEGKQLVPGAKSGTDWEIDGKGVKVGADGFVIIEARRYNKSKQNQERVAALAYRISDTGASGAILVSPLGFQEGAKKVADAENIIEFLMGPNNTRTDYAVKFLNQVFIGATGHIKITGSAVLTVVGPDGQVKASSGSVD